MLLKNALYTLLGKSFLVIFTIISVPIYLSQIGIAEYATIGIVFSFFYLVLSFDVPSYLLMVKYRYDRNLKKDYTKLMSSLFFLLVLTNLILFPLLALFAFFLAKTVYKDQALLPFFLIAAMVFMLIRANNFFADLLRSRKEESSVQKIAAACIILEFFLTMLLLFAFKLGIWSIFIGILVKLLVQYILLLFAVRKLVNLALGLSFELVMPALKKYALANYKINIMGNIIFNSGLFLSTFFLPRESIGILSIFFKFIEHLRGFTSEILFIHLQPVFAQLLASNRPDRIKQVLERSSKALLAFSVLVMGFLLTVGEHAYSFYFGAAFQGTYNLFVLVISAMLMPICMTPLLVLLFIDNTDFFKKLYSVSFLLFIFAVSFGLFHGKLDGVVISYSFFFYFYSVLVLYFGIKLLSVHFPRILKHFSLIILLQLATLLIFNPGIFMPLIFFTISAFILSINILNPEGGKIPPYGANVAKYPATKIKLFNNL